MALPLHLPGPHPRRQTRPRVQGAPPDRRGTARGRAAGVLSARERRRTWVRAGPGVIARARPVAGVVLGAGWDQKTCAWPLASATLNWSPPKLMLPALTATPPLPLSARKPPWPREAWPLASAM